MADELVDPVAAADAAAAAQSQAQTLADPLGGWTPGASASSSTADSDQSAAQQQQQRRQQEAVQDYLNRSWTSLYNQANPPPPTPSETPIRDVAKDVASSAAQGIVGSTLDVAGDPFAAAMKPVAIGGVAAYDALAPHLGMPQSTPEFRQALFGEPGQATDALSKIPGANPFTHTPTTSIGKDLDAPIQSTMGALAAGPGGVIRRTALGAAGGAAGEAVGNQVDPRYAPLVAMATNALVQGGGHAALPNPGASIDAADAAVAQRSQAMFGIPFRAQDATPGSLMRSPAHLDDLNDALRRNVVQQMGENPDTGLAETSNKVTPAVIDSTLTRSGNTIDTIGKNNTIGQLQAATLRTRLGQLDNDINSVTGLSQGDPAIMRQGLAGVRNAIDPNGTMSGTSYLGLVQKGSFLDRLAGSSNPAVANIALQTIEAVHDAMSRSLSNQDQGALTNARYQYRLAKTVEPLVGADRTGNINAGDLAARITAQSDLLDSGKYNIARTGGGTIGALGDAASLIARGAPAKSLNPIAPMLAAPATAAVPFLLGHPLWQSLAMLAAPNLAQLPAAAVMRSPSYANRAFQNSRMPPNPIHQGLLGAATGAEFP
jgi:hypothetical protein